MSFFELEYLSLNLVVQSIDLVEIGVYDSLACRSALRYGVNSPTGVVDRWQLEELISSLCSGRGNLVWYIQHSNQ